ncbi:MAG: thioredoxin family protein [Bacteroidia bacterium]
MSKSKLYLFCFFLLFPFAFSFAQNVQWITWEQMIEKSKYEKRKIVVDIYTEGCMPCKNMDLTTFANPTVAKSLNDCYYAVKFDAKQKNEMHYKDRNYEYDCNHGTCFHTLAFELTSGQLSFPSVVFLDENMNIIQQLPNFQEANHFYNVMGWVCQNYYKKMPFSNYKKIVERKK